MGLVDIKRALRKNVLVSMLLRRYYTSVHNKNVIRLQKYGYTINDEIEAALNGRLEHFAWAGTLLGIIRDNGFIKGDDDLDYCVNAKNVSDWNSLYEKLTEAGFNLHHYFIYNGTITEMAFSKYGLGIDFFGLQPYDGRICTISYYRDAREKYRIDEASCIRTCINPYSKILEIDINGSNFLIPDNYEEFLSSNYGSGWKVPQKASYTDLLGERYFMPKERGKLRHRWNL